jgi:hypothetical protein
MLLLCALFALLTIGFVIPCLIDIAMTPSDHFDLPSKQTWLIVGAAFWAFGAAAWLLVGRRDVRMRAVCDEVSSGLIFADESSLWSSRRHGPGLRYVPRPSRHAQRGPQGTQGPWTAMAPADFVAPDDNQDFLLELGRRIRDRREDA